VRTPSLGIFTADQDTDEKEDGRAFVCGLHGICSRQVLVAASTVAIVAIAVAVIVVALVVWYVLPRGSRRNRPRRTEG
jgi:hypothetical protein